MDKLIEKLFDLQKIPAQTFFIFFLACSCLLFIPTNLLDQVKLSTFKESYGEFIGLIWLISLIFTAITLLRTLLKFIKTRHNIRKIKGYIIEHINNLILHEKAILREFYIQNKDAIGMPFDDDTVMSLEAKRIIYKVSSTGMVYDYGVIWGYAISQFAKRQLTYNNIELPQNPNQDQINWIIEHRPQWAQEQTQRENLRKGLFY